MQLRPQDLAAYLSRTLVPLYVVYGDEPLGVIAAGDAIRAAARRAGCEEREVSIVEQHFRWDAFVAANANLGLFGARKLIERRACRTGCAGRVAAPPRIAPARPAAIGQARCQSGWLRPPCPAGTGL